jgi:hypothetical protein
MKVVFQGESIAGASGPGDPRPALQAMLETRSIAVVGASARPDSVGSRMLAEVVRSPSILSSDSKVPLMPPGRQQSAPTAPNGHATAINKATARAGRSGAGA